jgi:hypothetical protein
MATDLLQGLQHGTQATKTGPDRTPELVRVEVLLPESRSCGDCLPLVKNRRAHVHLLETESLGRMLAQAVLTHADYT